MQLALFMELFQVNNLVFICCRVIFSREQSAVAHHIFFSMRELKKSMAEKLLFYYQISFQQFPMQKSQRYLHITYQLNVQQPYLITHHSVN